MRAGGVWAPSPLPPQFRGVLTAPALCKPLRKGQWQGPGWGHSGRQSWAAQGLRRCRHGEPSPRCRPQQARRAPPPEGPPPVLWAPPSSPGPLWGRPRDRPPPPAAPLPRRYARARSVPLPPRHRVHVRVLHGGPLLQHHRLLDPVVLLQLLPGAPAVERVPAQRQPNRWARLHPRAPPANSGPPGFPHSDGCGSGWQTRARLRQQRIFKKSPRGRKSLKGGASASGGGALAQLG